MHIDKIDYIYIHYHNCHTYTDTNVHTTVSMLYNIRLGMGTSVKNVS